MIRPLALTFCLLVAGTALAQDARKIAEAERELATVQARIESVGSEIRDDRRKQDRRNAKVVVSDNRRRAQRRAGMRHGNNERRGTALECEDVHQAIPGSVPASATSPLPVTRSRALAMSSAK